MNLTNKVDRVVEFNDKKNQAKTTFLELDCSICHISLHVSEKNIWSEPYTFPIGIPTRIPLRIPIRISTRIPIGILQELHSHLFKERLHFARKLIFVYLKVVASMYLLELQVKMEFEIPIRIPILQEFHSHLFPAGTDGYGIPMVRGKSSKFLLKTLAKEVAKLALCQKVDICLSISSSIKKDQICALSVMDYPETCF